MIFRIMNFRIPRGRIYKQMAVMKESVHQIEGPLQLWIVLGQRPQAIMMEMEMKTMQQNQVTRNQLVGHHRKTTGSHTSPADMNQSHRKTLLEISSKEIVVLKMAMKQ